MSSESCSADVFLTRFTSCLPLPVSLLTSSVWFHNKNKSNSLSWETPSSTASLWPKSPFWTSRSTPTPCSSTASTTPSSPTKSGWSVGLTSIQGSSLTTWRSSSSTSFDSTSIKATSMQRGSAKEKMRSSRSLWTSFWSDTIKQTNRTYRSFRSCMRKSQMSNSA